MIISQIRSSNLYSAFSKLKLAGILFFLFSLGIYSCKNHNDGPCLQPIYNPHSSYDSLREIYDSIVSQYNASRILIDGLSTKTSVQDSELRKKNAEITVLKNSKQEIETKKIIQIENKNTNLKKELIKEVTANSTLKELGSILHASNIRLYPLHISTGGKKTRLVRRGKKLNVLRLFFDVDENYIANTGSRTLYIVITAPDGKLLPCADYKPGYFLSFNGLAINYSMYKEITMQRNLPVKNIFVNCKIGDNHQKGNYNVSIYTGGYRIGSETIKLM